MTEITITTMIKVKSQVRISNMNFLLAATADYINESISGEAIS